MWAGGNVVSRLPPGAQKLGQEPVCHFSLAAIPHNSLAHWARLEDEDIDWGKGKLESGTAAA